MTSQNFMKRVSQDASAEKNKTSEIMREKSQDFSDKKEYPQNSPLKDLKPLNLTSKALKLKELIVEA